MMVKSRGRRGRATCSDDFDKTLVADPRSTVTSIYRACCVRQSAWNAPRLSNNRPPRRRVCHETWSSWTRPPDYPSMPLIIYNLSRFNVSPMLWSIFATRSTRFVLWINRMGKYIYGQTDVIWKVFDIWRGKKQCCFLINFYVWGKRESFSCLLNYCLASYPLNFPCLIRDGGRFFVEIVIIAWWYLNEEAFSIL